MSILYLSCNLFSSLWLPFLKILKKYISFDINIHICTDLEVDIDLEKEIKKYNTNILIYGEKSNLNEEGNLYKRLNYYLNNINVDNILYFHDDMFPNKTISENIILNMLSILNKDDNIKLIKLSHASYDWNHAKKLILTSYVLKKQIIRKMSIFSIFSRC